MSNKSGARNGAEEVNTDNHNGVCLCEICGAETADIYKMRRHVRRHAYVKSHHCQMCPKAFKTRDKLNTHMRSHTGEKPMTCEICGLGLASSGALILHKRVHTGERPFVCGLCQKPFVSKGQLQRHERTHTGERPYVCQLCSATFVDSSNLKTHMRVHTGERPFGCDVCGKRFTMKNGLKTHSRIHSGEKPFVCDTCGAAYPGSSQLHAHRRRAHLGVKSYHCHVCGMGYTKSNYLHSHMSRNHPEIVHALAKSSSACKKSIKLTLNVSKVEKCLSGGQVTSVPKEPEALTVSSVSQMEDHTDISNQKQNVRDVSIFNTLAVTQEILLMKDAGAVPTLREKIDKNDGYSVQNIPTENPDRTVLTFTSDVSKTNALILNTNRKKTAQFVVTKTQVQNIRKNAKNRQKITVSDKCLLKECHRKNNSRLNYRDACRSDTVQPWKPAETADSPPPTDCNNLLQTETVCFTPSYHDSPQLEEMIKEMTESLNRTEQACLSANRLTSAVEDGENAHCWTDRTGLKEDHVTDDSVQSSKQEGNTSDDIKCSSEVNQSITEHQDANSTDSRNVHKCTDNANSSGRLYCRGTCPRLAAAKKTQSDGVSRANNKNFLCDICGSGFGKKEKLKEHVRIHTGEKPFKCDYCPKAFRTKTQKKSHEISHTGKTPYVCDFCGAGRSCLNALKIHKRIHTGEKPFACEMCQKAFTTKGQLEAHERIHTGERPFVCDVCHAGFKGSTALTMHLRIHTGEKPFDCGVCGKKFAVKSALTSHFRVHTGERPYVCDICGSTYSTSGQLTAHRKRAHTGEKSYTCPQCGAGLTKNKYLKSHMRRYHS